MSKIKKIDDQNDATEVLEEKSSEDLKINQEDSTTESSTPKKEKKNKASKKKTPTEKKPAKVLTKKQNILIWVSISVLGVLSGGGTGTLIMNALGGDEREIIDTSQFTDNSADREAKYHSWLYANDPANNSQYEEIYKGLYGTSIEHTEVSYYLSIPDILNISFNNLDAGGDYAIESKGGLTTTIGAVAVAQFLTASHVKCGNTYYYENDSKSDMVAFGMRYIMEDTGLGENNIVRYHEGAKSDIIKDAHDFVHCKFPSTPKETFTDAHYAELYGGSLTGSNIYLISSKTLSKEEGHEASIETLDDGYRISIRLTKRACQDYITQIINSSFGAVKNVSAFNYSDWVITLDKNLRPIHRLLKEQYDTKTAYLVTATCTSEINEYFYYSDISLPDYNEYYIQKIENK